jgi:hypothetical protein
MMKKIRKQNVKLNEVQIKKGNQTMRTRIVFGSLLLALVFTTVVSVSAHADETFLLSPPCRMHDSRVTGAAKLVANVELLGEGQENCNGSIPKWATGVYFTFTIINPPGNGWLKAYASDESTPSSVTMTYAAGQNTSASALVRLRTHNPELSAFDFKLLSLQSADFVIDVTGYTMPGLNAETHGTIASRQADCNSNGIYCKYTFGLSSGSSGSSGVSTIVCDNANMDTSACGGYIVGDSVQALGHLKENSGVPTLYAHTIRAF